jgi:hypothetical protein
MPSKKQAFFMVLCMALGFLLGGVRGAIAVLAFFFVGSAILSPPAYLASVKLPSLTAPGAMSGGSSGGGGGGGGGGGRRGPNIRYLKKASMCGA